ncbi:hypothetical protein llap_6425 [Limosa lapponica baueri]|uniref:Uncharacterized protein n=1 Tax=Limosa lapponica baueri TaxID=1758121 RepID=A0A2I0UBB6_LIMLA|nr:hypothetical protein llap_6425 [Limosa lapponica baueri]
MCSQKSGALGDPLGTSGPCGYLPVASSRWPGERETLFQEPTLPLLRRVSKREGLTKKQNIATTADKVRQRDGLGSGLLQHFAGVYSRVGSKDGYPCGMLGGKPRHTNLENLSYSYVESKPDPKSRSALVLLVRDELGKRIFGNMAYLGKCIFDNMQLI